MFARPACLLFSAGAVLAGCTGADLPAEPRAIGAAASPGALLASGATVQRFESGGRFFFVHTSPTAGYTFTLGLVTPVADLAFCGGTVRPAVVDANWTTQIVRGPGGTIHYLEVLDGPATIVLYGAPLVPPSTCQLADVPVVATGTVTTHVTNDNDLLGSAQGANSWGRRLVGTVELASGGTARIVIVQRFVALPGDPEGAAIKPVVDRILLQPIGGQ